MKSFMKLTIMILCLWMSFSAPVPSDYTPQNELTLIPSILNLGYSNNQQMLVVLGQNIEGEFYIFNGIRYNNKRTIQIVTSEQVSNVTASPSCFAFSPNDDMLVIGTKEGFVYGFVIEAGQLVTPYSYYYNASSGEESIIRSVSINTNGIISVGTKGKVSLIRTNSTNFKQNSNILTSQPFVNQTQIFYPNHDIYSTAWNPIAPQLLLIGGIGTDNGTFEFYNHSSGMPTISINLNNTFSCLFYSDGVHFFQSGPSIDIQVYNYENPGDLNPINNTMGATELSVGGGGRQLGAEIGGTNVSAWTISPGAVQNLRVINTVQQNLQALNFQQSLNQQGRNLALTSSGNQLLIIPTTGSTIPRYSLCIDGQLLNQTSNECLQCDPNCKTCFNEITQCQSCNGGSFLNENNVCAECSTKINGCVDCNEDGSACITCDDAANWNPQPDAQGQCVCADNYYNNKGTCALCSDAIIGCDRCSDANTCTICTDKGNFQPQPKPDGTCGCLNGFTLNNDECSACSDLINNCVECSDIQTCTLCNVSYFVNDGACSLCSEAIPGCETCTDSNTCTQCTNQGNFNPNVLPDGSCGCLTGFALVDGICQGCPSLIEGCVECESESNCTLCDQGGNFNPQPDQNGECICEDTYFKNTTGCQRCDKQIDDCLTCSQDGSQCLTCQTEHKVVIDQTKCVCDDFYYEDANQQCQQCDPFQICKVCSAPGNCSQCNDQAGWKPQPLNNTCVCDEGYYQNQTSCIACDVIGCAVCPAPENCTICNQNKGFKPNITAEKTCQCQQFRYLNAQQRRCALCSQPIPGCLTCNANQTKITCEQCNTTQNFVRNVTAEGRCKCVDNYYLNDRVCDLCSGLIDYCLNCEKVGEKVKCMKCYQTFIEGDDGSCVCGEDEEIKDGRCEPDGGLSPLAIIAIIVGILAIAGAAVAVWKCLKKKRSSPLEGDEYEALDNEK